MNHRHSRNSRSGRMLLPAALLATSGLFVQQFCSVAFSMDAPAASVEAAVEATVETAGLQEDTAKNGQKKPAKVGRGRLSGKQAPPKPAAVPKSRTGRPVQVGDNRPNTPTATPGFPKKQLTPEQQKAQKEYLAKQKAAGAAGAGGVARGAAPRPPKNPNAKLQIDFGTEKHDFGKARQGDQLTHVFKMKSGGSEPLIISQASPTCGCTLGELKVRAVGGDIAELYKFGEPIEPGAEIELAATLDTGSKRNRTNVRINVYSNDGIAGQTQLQLQANVEPFIVASPQFLQLGDIREGVERTATVDFRTSGGERIMLTPDKTRPVQTPEGLTVDLQPMNADEAGKSNHWRATFLISGDSAEGPKGHLLRLASDVLMPQSKIATPAKEKAKKAAGPQFYMADANISYRILGALSLQPQYVSMGLVRPGQVVVRNVRLTSHEAEFDLSKVKVSVTGEGQQALQWSDKFVASVKPVSGSNAVDIELRLTGLPDQADGSFRGRVKIATGHTAKPEMDFRFSGVCRKLAASVQRPGGAVKPAPAVKKAPAPVKKGAGQ